MAALAAAAGAVPAGGCRGPMRDCAPAAPEVCQAACDPARRDAAADFQVLADRLRGDGPAAPPPPGRTYQILAMSGGGRYGAFTAGVLRGWSDHGDRPVFDIVTGVSTGALVATFAFLGPEYDTRLGDLATGITNSDVFRRRRFLAIPWATSLARSDPLRRLIAAEITDRMIDEVAAAHAAGRRLYVGTTNLDTKRLVVWDLGAIAAGGRPDRYTLFRKVLLASAAIPGQFPPVEFDVTVNGHRYTELHVDGGVTSEVFLRLSLLEVPPEQLRAGARPLAGSTIHAIVAGKLFADPTCTTPRLFGILRNSVTSLIYAMTENDLLRIYTLSLLTGMDFRFTALRQDFVEEGSTVGFDPRVQRQLYDEGYQVGRAGDAGWRTDPPGFRPAEQVIPRAGTDFTIPGR